MASNDLSISVGLDTDALKHDAAVLGGILQSVGDVAKTALGTALGFGLAHIAGGITDIAHNALTAGIGFNRMKEEAMTSFGTMLGSVDKANVLMKQLNDLAKDTPYGFEEIAKATKSLLAANVGPEAIKETLTRIGDIASGLNIPFGELSDIYGKIKTQGRLFGEDINQLQGRGIPIIQELAKQFGVSESAVKGMVEKGKIGFPQIEKAFVSLTSKGGKFSGMMIAQSKTFNGMLSTAKDTFAQLSGKVMEPLFNLMKEGLEFMLKFGDSAEFQKWVDDAAQSINLLVTGAKEFFAAIQSGDNPIRALVNTLKMFDKTSALGEGLEHLAVMADEFFGALKKGMSPLDAFINTLQQFSDTSAIGDVLRGIVDGVRKLVDAVKVGDWGAAWKTIVSGLDALGGALNTKLAEAIQGAKDWHAKNGPATWDTLTKWADEFWNWLTNPTDGAIGKVAAKILEIATPIATELGKAWTETIQPALAEWATKFWGWLTDPKTGALATLTANMATLLGGMEKWAKSDEAKATLERAGYDIANGLIAAIKSIFADDAEGDSLIKTLIANLERATASTHELFKTITGSLAKGFWQSAAEAFGADQTTKQIAGAIGEALTNGATDFILSGGPLGIAIKIVAALVEAVKKAWATTDWGDWSLPQFKLPGLQGAPPTLPPGDLPSSHNAAFMQGGNVTFQPNITFNAMLDGQEVKNAVLKMTYSEVDTMFNQAKAQALAA